MPRALVQNPEAIRDPAFLQRHALPRDFLARHPELALEYLQDHRPDLMITDLSMAAVSGWDLLFHENLQRPELPIFVITRCRSRRLAAPTGSPTDFSPSPSISMHCSPPCAVTWEFRGAPVTRSDLGSCSPHGKRCLAPAGKKWGAGVA